MFDTSSNANMPILFFPTESSEYEFGPEQTDISEILIKLATQIAPPRAILFIGAQWVEKTVSLFTTNWVESGDQIQTNQTEREALLTPVAELPEAIVRRLKYRKIPCKIELAEEPEQKLSYPLSTLFPDNKIPLYRLSLMENLNPEQHMILGESISWLRNQGVLIIGAGSVAKPESYNEPLMSNDLARKSFLFDQWLNEVITAPSVAVPMRKVMLSHWEKAPHANFCHPQLEHLLPIHVCCGAADYQPANLVYNHSYDGMQASGFIWNQ